MRQFFIFIFMIMSVVGLFAQKMSIEQVKEQLEFFNKSVDIPSKYHFKNVQQVKVDDKTAYWFRYDKDSNSGIGNEHYSFLVTDKKPFKILGFTHMDTSYADMQLLSEKEAEEVAIDFLKKIDSQLETELTKVFTERHDEEIFVNGKKTTISGMKYKTYRKASDDYAWVVVAGNGNIITFERDIHWTDARQMRITEKWLHDMWLSEMKKLVSLY